MSDGDKITVRVGLGGAMTDHTGFLGFPVNIESVGGKGVRSTVVHLHDQSEIDTLSRAYKSDTTFQVPSSFFEEKAEVQLKMLMLSQ